MVNKWGIKCNTHDNTTASTWWLNWRELVFYAVADDYKPANNNPPAIPCAAAGKCLSVNPPSAAESKKFVVIVAGKKLAALNQQRGPAVEKKVAANYLEGENAVTPLSFEQKSPSTTFNDVVVFE